MMRGPEEEEEDWERVENRIIEIWVTNKLLLVSGQNSENEKHMGLLKEVFEVNKVENP